MYYFRAGLTVFLGAVICCTTPKFAKTTGHQGRPAMIELNAPVENYRQRCSEELAAATDALAALANSTDPATVDSVLEPLNRLRMTIDRGFNRAALFNAVHPDALMRTAAEECEQAFSSITTSVGLSQSLFALVGALDISKEDVVTRRWVKHLLRDFRRSGVDKDAATREKIKSLKKELVAVGQTFARNIREDVRSIEIDPAELAGLPSDYVAAHRPNAAGKVTITTDTPDSLPFMTYAISDAARLALYKAGRNRGFPANQPVLNSLIHKRFALAQLLGYSNWAHYITEDKMIKTADNARQFIDKIAAATQERAARDYAQLLKALQSTDKSATAVGDWQKSYLEELVKKEAYAFDSQELRQYFSYDKARDGLFAVTSEMFGVEYRPMQMPTWHEDVEAFEIVEDGVVVGRFYLDMHPRTNKYKHAAAFPLVTGVRGVQVPEAVLVCNFPAQGPMEHDQVETFFHEFGHLIHHLFGGKHRWVSVSGFNTEWDFVEAPSQMLEEWAWTPDSLRRFARNDAGEVIPDALLQAMNKARNFGKGTWVANQMFYAAVSLNFYDRDPRELDTTETMKELQARFSPYEYVPGTHFHLSFGHLDEYSAIYYTYMWSLVIAKDLFSVFQEKGMMDRGIARRYRQFVLGPGGSVDADTMVRDFLQRDYSFDSFSSWLNEG